MAHEYRFSIVASFSANRESGRENKGHTYISPVNVKEKISILMFPIFSKNKILVRLLSARFRVKLSFRVCSIYPPEKRGVGEREPRGKHMHICPV